MSAVGRLLARLCSVAPASPDRPTRLVDCPDCGAETVVPVRWQEAGEMQWWMRLRCGTCGAVREAVLDDEQASAFGEDLDRGTARLAAALSELERERMADLLRSLEGALARDLIDATDFGPRHGTQRAR